MLTSKKKYSGRAKNKSGEGGAKVKIGGGGGQCPLCPPAGDAPVTNNKIMVSNVKNRKNFKTIVLN